MALLSGSSASGFWALGLQLGVPFQWLRGQYGFSPGWTLFAEIHSESFSNLSPSLGLAWRLLPFSRLRLTAEFLLGGVFRLVEGVREGPSAVLRLRLLWIGYRVSPYLGLAWRSTFHFSQKILHTATGSSSRLSLQYIWTPAFSLGLAFSLHKSWGLDIGIDGAWENASRFVVPGFHLGLHFGAGP